MDIGYREAPPKTFINIAAILIRSKSTAGAMNPASVQPLCLSVSAACEKIVEMKQKTGGGRNPESLIRRIGVKKLRKARPNQKNTSINTIYYSFNEVFGINVFLKLQVAL